jgi:hypothetical protein
MINDKENVVNLSFVFFFMKTHVIHMILILIINLQKIIKYLFFVVILINYIAKDFMFSLIKNELTTILNMN